MCFGFVIMVPLLKMARQSGTHRKSKSGGIPGAKSQIPTRSNEVQSVPWGGGLILSVEFMKKKIFSKGLLKNLYLK